jgi:hypothetical protein
MVAGPRGWVRIPRDCTSKLWTGHGTGAHTQVGAAMSLTHQPDCPPPRDINDPKHPCECAGEMRMLAIVPKLSAAEIEHVIKLLARSPRVYAPGTLDALKQRRALVSPEPPQQSGERIRSKELPPEKRHTGGRGADPRSQPSRGQPRCTKRLREPANRRGPCDGVLAGCSVA